MLIKACGLRSSREIDWAWNLGYDLLGVVVDPRSKRYVSPPELEVLWREGLEHLADRCVFVARQWEHLAGCEAFGGEVLFQSYDGYPDRIPNKRRFLPVVSEEQWRQNWERQSAVYYLYDVSLGTGEWRGLPSWCQNKERLFVAGGLDDRRLEGLARQLESVPEDSHGWNGALGQGFFGMDLSSGLEGPDDSGGRSRKDYDKMSLCLDVIRKGF
ncbi:MAG: hypothetical protein AAF975_08460 [Spirochaetota bacterium]